MMEADTEIRAGVCESAMDPEDVKRRRIVDRRNTARLKEIIAHYGWPTYGMVGKQAAIAAWLMVQHGDHDVAFQQQCLPLLKAAFEQGEAQAKCLAYLIDRVRVNTGRPQVYGTQFLLIDGKNQPRPIENAAHVDERREQMGLSTLAEYTRMMQGG